MRPDIKPRYYQKDSSVKFFQYIDESPGKHPLIVLPTAAGKSLVMAMIVEKMLEWEGTRVLIMAHRKGLLEQNSAELDGLLNNIFIDIGVYSAGLKKRDTDSRILFAGIQSVWNKAYELGHFDVILIDECHRISVKSDGTYRHFLKEMTDINPKIVIGGLTATHYRMRGGLICDPAHKERIFDEVCHEVGIRELIDPSHPKNRDKKQYLCPVISPSKAMKSKADMRNVRVVNGDYAKNEMEDAFCVNGLVEEAVSEIVSYTTDRKKVLIFTAGIRHCIEVYNSLKRKGFPVGVVHSQQTAEENAKALDDFAKGVIKYLCNIDVLTEGYNQKDIDCIVLLRATQSIGLYVQIVGRGFRQHPDKENCLILDFGGNIERHGPVDKIEIRKHRDGTGRSTIVTSPQKECPKCTAMVAITALVCDDCGFEFPLPDRHEGQATEKSILSEWKPPEKTEVSYIEYSRHQKAGKPDSMRVDYHIHMGLKLSEFVCLDHDHKFAVDSARKWVRLRAVDGPMTVNDALEFAKEKKFREAKEVYINFNGQFPKIVSHVFETDEEFHERVTAKERKAAAERDEALGNLLGW